MLQRYSFISKKEDHSSYRQDRLPALCQSFVITGTNTVPLEKPINRLINFVPSKMKMEKPDKRSSILTSAEELFSSLGYEGTSTRQIAKEAGANMSMINYYFGSKEGVFLEIMNRRLKDFKSELTSINEDRIPPMQKLFKVIDRYARRILSNIAFHKMLHRELSLSQRPEIFCSLRDAVSANLLAIEKILEEGMAAGSFRAVDNRMLIITIMGTITSVATTPSKVTDGSDLDIQIPEEREILTQRLITYLEDLVKTYLTPQK